MPAINQRRVLLVGPYGGKNLGDELILSRISRSICVDGHEVTATSQDAAYTQRAHELASILPVNIRKLQLKTLSRLKDFDAIVIGGGEQLQESRLANPLWGLLTTVALVVAQARRHNKPVMLWGIGVDRVASPVGKWLTRSVVRNAAIVTVRDPASRERLIALGLDGTRIHLTADPGFQVNREAHANGREFLSKLMGSSCEDGKFLVLSPANDRYVSREKLAVVVQACREVMAGIGGKLFIHFMDNQARYDGALRQTPMFKEDQVLRQIPPHDFSENVLAKIYAGADGVVSARMHPLILATTQGTPWVNLSRSVKMDSFGEMLGRPPSRLAGVDLIAMSSQAKALMATCRYAWQAEMDPRARDLANRSMLAEGAFRTLLRGT